MTEHNQPTAQHDKLPEKLLTIRQASTALGLPYRPLLLAVETGRIPAYRVGESRRMVFVSQVLASICVNHDKED